MFCDCWRFYCHKHPPLSLTTMTRDSNSARRAPLEPLPLSYILPLDNILSHTSTIPKPTTKRPRSPSLLLSPTKRRILRQEGVLSTSESRTRPRQSRRIHDYGTVTVGPENSPTLSTIGHESVLTQPMDIDLFQRGQQTPVEGSKVRLITPSRSPSKIPHILPEHLRDRDTAPNYILSLVPRGPPPVPDRQSLHYPGFDVHYDTHVSLPSGSSSLEDVTSNLNTDKEGMKENILIQKKSRKLSTLSTDTYTAMETSRIPSSKSSPCRPTPRKVTISQVSKTPSSYRTSNHSPKVRDTRHVAGSYSHRFYDKISGKRALELEVDDICSDDDFS